MTLTKEKIIRILIIIILSVIALLFLFPFYLILISSFKSKSTILERPFSLPTHFNFNYYQNGIEAVNYWNAFLNSLFITITSVILIVIVTAVTAWVIVRSKSKFTKFLYYLFLISMVVPFQLVMYPMIYTASNYFMLDNILGIVILYIGFGAGLSVFLFVGFLKSIPIEIEEAALIDGCSAIKTFIYIVFPILKPTIVTVAILNAMWIWNDYLLPYYILPSDSRTIPVAINALVGNFGTVRYSEMSSLITLTIIPIIVIYLILQKHIIEGITAGSVKF